MSLVWRSKDFWSGVMLIAIGITAMMMARDYPFGTTLRMGPGYFPTVLGGLLILGGLYLAVKGLRSGEEIEGGLSLRALIVIPLSLALFGFLMDRAGFVPATMVLIFGSAMGGSEFKPLEVLAFAAGLTFLCVVVFVWGLGLPYPLLADF
jgi:hypothetical protein